MNLNMDVHLCFNSTVLIWC